MELGLCGTLTIIFIVLKLTDVISWSWVWVFSPLWIPLAIIGGILAFIVLLFIVAIIFKFVFSAVNPY